MKLRIEGGYDIASEEYGLNFNGSKMFWVFKFHPYGNSEYTCALGLRNSHDKTMAVGLTVGLKVIVVCDNLAFGGDVAFIVSTQAVLRLKET